VVKATGGCIPAALQLLRWTKPPALRLDKLADIKSRLPAINHADSEEVLGAMATLIGATLRTNYFQNNQKGDKIIFKFDTSNLSLVPEPRPFREIFVFSRRFEGVHLRGGLCRP
jgi:glutamate dehydrogenase